MEVTDVVPSDPDANPGTGPQPVTYLLQNSVLTLQMGTPMTPKAES